MRVKSFFVLAFLLIGSVIQCISTAPTECKKKSFGDEDYSGYSGVCNTGQDKEECIISCDKGYAYAANTLICNAAKNSWEGNLPVCVSEAPKDCDLKVFDGEGFEEECPPGDEGEECKIGCDEYHTGEPTFKNCTAEGSWIGSDPQCVPLCDMDHIFNKIIPELKERGEKDAAKACYNIFESGRINIENVGDMCLCYNIINQIDPEFEMNCKRHPKEKLTLIGEREMYCHEEVCDLETILKTFDKQGSKGCHYIQNLWPETTDDFAVCDCYISMNYDDVADMNCRSHMGEKFTILETRDNCYGHPKYGRKWCQRGEGDRVFDDAWHMEWKMKNRHDSISFLRRELEDHYHEFSCESFIKGAMYRQDFTPLTTICTKSMKQFMTDEYIASSKTLEFLNNDFDLTQSVASFCPQTCNHKCEKPPMCPHYDDEEAWCCDDSDLLVEDRMEECNAWCCPDGPYCSNNGKELADKKDIMTCTDCKADGCVEKFVENGGCAMYHDPHHGPHEKHWDTSFFGISKDCEANCLFESLGACKVCTEVTFDGSRRQAEWNLTIDGDVQCQSGDTNCCVPADGYYEVNCHGDWTHSQLTFGEKVICEKGMKYQKNKPVRVAFGNVCGQDGSDVGDAMVERSYRLVFDDYPEHLYAGVDCESLGDYISEADEENGEVMNPMLKEYCSASLHDVFQFVYQDKSTTLLDRLSTYHAKSLGKLFKHHCPYTCQECPALKSCDQCHSERKAEGGCLVYEEGELKEEMFERSRCWHCYDSFEDYCKTTECPDEDDEGDFVIQRDFLKLTGVPGFHGMGDKRNLNKQRNNRGCGFLLSHFEYRFWQDEHHDGFFKKMDFNEICSHSVNELLDILSDGNVEIENPVYDRELSDLCANTCNNCPEEIIVECEEPDGDKFVADVHYTIYGKDYQQFVPTCRGFIGEHGEDICERPAREAFWSFHEDDDNGYLYQPKFNNKMKYICPDACHNCPGDFGFIDVESCFCHGFGDLAKFNVAYERSQCQIHGKYSPAHDNMFDCQKAHGKWVQIEFHCHEVNEHYFFHPEECEDRPKHLIENCCSGAEHHHHHDMEWGHDAYHAVFGADGKHPTDHHGHGHLSDFEVKHHGHNPHHNLGPNHGMPLGGSYMLMGVGLLIGMLGMSQFCWIY